MFRMWKLAAVVGVIMVFALAGCDQTNQGSAPPNNPPRVFFANIPVDGTTFSVNPTLFWYGTDNDGTIEQYQYAVLRQVDVVDYLESRGVAIDTLPPVLYLEYADSENDFDWLTIWVDSVQTATRDNIRLFASFDTNYVVQVDETCTPPCTTYVMDCEQDSVGFVDGQVVYDTLNCVSESIQQYMFIRAIDDDNAASEIKFREYLRNNHWPQTKIENAIPFSAVSYLNVRRPLPTFAGIPLSWTGSDSADYPRTQPDFEFWYRVFGPFASPEEADTTDPDMLVFDSGDSLTADGEWVRRPYGVWVLSKSATLFDFWRVVDQNGSVDTTREAYFLFEVRARDDAFAADPSPACVTFKVIDPKFEKQIFFVDDVNYSSALQPLSPMGSGADGVVNYDLLHDRIFDILYDATDGAIDMDADSPDFYRLWNTPRPNPSLTLEQVTRYPLVLIVDDDDVSKISDDNAEILAEYMNVGGNVWVFGRNCFLNEEPLRIGEPTVFPAGGVADFYFDIEAIYLPLWTKRSITVDSNLVFHFIPGIDDFIGAKPVGDMVGVFTPLNVDTALTKDYYINDQVRVLAGIVDFRFKTIPDANFIQRGSAAEPIYTYVSRYSSTAYPNDKVCAVRYIGPSEFDPVFKSAWFSFSPYGIKHEQMVEVFRTMLTWFNE